MQTNPFSGSNQVLTHLLWQLRYSALFKQRKLNYIYYIYLQLWALSEPFAPCCWTLKLSVNALRHSSEVFTIIKHKNDYLLIKLLKKPQAGLIIKFRWDYLKKISYYVSTSLAWNYNVVIIKKAIHLFKQRHTDTQTNC